MTPQHVRIEALIRADERAAIQRRPPVSSEALASYFAYRVALYVNDTRDTGATIYMYARRAAHWGLLALGEPRPDLLATYYRRA